jgi:hypothetical protein
MKETKSTKKEIKSEKKQQPPGRWMPAGIGAGATLGILFGSFVLGPAMGSPATGMVLGMSMGAGAGLVVGLSLGSKGSSGSVPKKKKS